ncbi:hypothetical protein [Novosphingobium sp.]|uniref:hypothetical protein n=1 Tax=Novosphingobium sp. TaxID=1874826 RepID=UPI00286DD81E|nr:hypothetical protein [Novosphingobium sp.]
MILKLIENYWKKVARGGPDECWPWTGARTLGGYGQISSGTRHHNKIARALATHIALAIDGRSRPSARHVAMHSCDRPGCVNPAHLAWGLPVENMRDMWTKQRAGHQRKAAAAMDSAAAELAVRTARNHKLSDEDVREIRASTERTCDLARRFDVSWTLIDNVRRRKARAEVPDFVGTSNVDDIGRVSRETA